MPTYTTTSDQSRFSVQAFAGGMLSSFAHNPTFAVRNFTAALEFDPASPGDASIELTADAGSLWLTDSVKASDREEIERLMRGEVLETAKYPHITFRSTKFVADKVTEGWFRMRISGELTLHGVTKSHELDAASAIARRPFAIQRRNGNPPVGFSPEKDLRRWLERLH